MQELEKKCSNGNCPDCEQREQEARENDEANFAVLVSLVPLLVLTFFSQVGML